MKDIHFDTDLENLITSTEVKYVKQWAKLHIWKIVMWKDNSKKHSLVICLKYLISKKNVLNILSHENHQDCQFLVRKSLNTYLEHIPEPTQEIGRFFRLKHNRNTLKSVFSAVKLLPRPEDSDKDWGSICRVTGPSCAPHSLCPIGKFFNLNPRFLLMF